MSETIVFPQPVGPNFHIPDVGDVNWGQNVTDFLVAIPNGVPPTAGLFALTGDLSFGTSFGLVTKYFKSISPDIASTGSFRLAHSDAIAFRNFANSADLLLAVDNSDNITFNGSTFGISGVVNPGVANQLAYYPASTDAVSGLASITANRALVSNASGLPIASTVTSTTLAFLDATSSVQTQINAVVTTANAALPKAGGTMTGNIAMGGNSITALANGVNPQDAATVAQLPGAATVWGPIGSSFLYSSITPPNANYAFKNGQAISRVTYSVLFALIGTTFGVGDGSTTFNIPDSRDRFPVGAGNIYSLGATGGATTHTLSVAELPSNIPVSITDPGHRHNFKSYGVAGGTTTEICLPNNANTAGALNTYSSATTGPQSNTTGITAIANGSDTAHSILNPYIAEYWMYRII